MDITGIGSIADLARDLVKRLWPAGMDESEKAKTQIALQQVLETRERQIAEAQRDIIVAELQQGDSYTKRARPTIVYAGLAAIFLVHVIAPILSAFLSNAVPSITLPEEFWYTWGGICGVWMVGRSAERIGLKSRIVDIVTGNKR